MRLEGEVAIVTGGASGLGWSFAQRFAAEGAGVVIGDIAGAADAAERLKETGADSLGIAVDTTEPDDVARLVAETMRAYGRIDILVNNAAISSTLVLKPFEQGTPAEWRRILDVNTIGVFLCCQAVAPHMRAAKRGRIINLASGTAFKGTPMLLPYVASKGAVISMTRALAQELGQDNILVNAVAPGYTVTDAMRANMEFYAASRDAAISTRALKREATANDIVGAVLFLASADAAFITGQILTVDGGSVYH